MPVARKKKRSQGGSKRGPKGPPKPGEPKRPGRAPRIPRAPKPGASVRPPPGGAAGAPGAVEAPEPKRSKPTRPANRPTGKAAGRPRGVTIRAEAGMALSRYVASQSGDAFSVREAKRLLESGFCRVNGRVETFGSRVLIEGDVVELVLPEQAPERTRQAFEPDRVIYVDDDLLVYDKPAGLAVTPPDKKEINDGGKSSEKAHAKLSLIGLVHERYPEARAVHRIDADTTGIVIFARTDDAKAGLEQSFKDQEVEKLYLALVRGVPRAEGTHKSFMVKVEAGLGFEKWASGHGEGSREAVTSWKVLERLGAWASLVEVRPETGRHHQIRIHMKELGHPLIGDTRYGDRRDPVPAGVIPRHMLHAAQVTFDHPTSKKRMVLKARPPIDFIAAEQVLKSSKNPDAGKPTRRPPGHAEPKGGPKRRGIVGARAARGPANPKSKPK
ncbi:MAG: RluA family pseudouridine synthase [Myxococcota bacterium]